MSCLTTLLLAFAFCLPQATLEEFSTPEEGASVLRELIIRKPGSPRVTVEDMQQRTIDLQAWLDRSEALELDFGPDQYITSFAMYGSAGSGRDEAAVLKRSEACSALLDYARRNNGFPEGSEVWGDWIGRLATVGFSLAVKEASWKDVAQSAIVMIPRSRDPRRSLEQVMKKLGDSDGLSSPLVRSGIAIAIARTDKFDLAEKDRHFAKLYGDQLPAGVQRPQKAAEQIAFTPFSGPSLDGEEIAVSDFKGKVLLIDYWATWCGPCLREMPNVVEAWRKHKDDGLAILGVSLDRANAVDKIRSTMTKYGMDWPQIYDGGGWQTKPARVNGVRSIPATFLLDREGNVVATNLRGAALEKTIAEVLARPAETTPNAD
ncbi:MAG: TlpA disulfide reductase family protein [Phycisphaerales bacterium]|nr:TlpA disulfide reductase family protein [Phycisphaerales bacterium]